MPDRIIRPVLKVCVSDGGGTAVFSKKTGEEMQDMAVVIPPVMDQEIDFTGKAAGMGDEFAGSITGDEIAFSPEIIMPQNIEARPVVQILHLKASEFFAAV